MNAEGGHHRHDDRAVVVAPYGSWRSPIDIEMVAGSAIALSEPWLDGDDVYWLESRSAQAGRRTLMRHTPDGATHELTPFPFKVGNRVHEYGGASYVVDRGRIVVSSSDDGRLWRISADGGAEPVPLTPSDGGRFADLRFDPLRERLYAVRETHDAREPDRPDLVVNELVTISLDGSDGAGRCSWPGPTSTPRPGRRPMAGRWPGSNGTSPTCRGTRSACVRPMSPTTVASAPPARSLVAPTSRSSSRPGAPTACCTSCRTRRPAGGTCSRSTATAASTARRGTWRRWRPSSATPRGSSAGRRTRSPTTAGSWPWPAPTVATHWYASRRTVPSNPWTRRSARSRGSRSRAGPLC